jgi:hypothetical protein
MTTSPQPHINLREPGELIAAIPTLLGFTPVDSLVLAVFDDTAAGCRLRLTMRADLPPPDLRGELAEQLVAPLLRTQPAAVALVVVGGRIDASGQLPHAELPGVVELALRGVGVSVVRSLWVERVCDGATWRCYDDPDCHGRMPDPNSTMVAEAAAALGVTTFDSREDMAASIAPDRADRLVRTSALLREASAEPQVCAVRADRGRRLLDELVDGFGGRLSLTDDQIVDMALALADPATRDSYLVTAFSDHADAAQRLWAELTKRSPAPFSAEPACLLAFSAYVRGDGAMTGIALDRAVTAHPGHRLAVLLRCALDTGLPPEEIRTMLSRLPARQVGGPVDELIAGSG